MSQSTYEATPHYHSFVDVENNACTLPKNLAFDHAYLIEIGDGDLACIGFTRWQVDIMYNLQKNPIQ